MESCQETVPEAITAFLEGENFTDVIRTAVSLGGDCDTLTCIAGSMAEAYYGIPEWLIYECGKRISPDMKNLLYRFNSQRSKLYISYKSEELRKFKVSDELVKTGDPERVKLLQDLLWKARNEPGKTEQLENAMSVLRKAFIDGELCLKTEQELIRDDRFDEKPCWINHYYRGQKSTESFLRLGLITEEDLEDPPEE